MNRMPPLNAMRAFEAAARTASFSLAAEELGVSAAAVSQQVKKLEDWFGKQLFLRSGNRITLTDAGHSIYPQVAKAFADISALSFRLSQSEVRYRLAISAPLSLVESWLMPRLSSLAQAYPHVSFDIRVEDDPVDLKRSGTDVRISYGAHSYPDAAVIPLFHDDVLPVCAPDFWRRSNGGAIGLANLPDAVFIHTNWGDRYASHPSWADWFTKAGSARAPDAAKGRRISVSSLAVSTARFGLGIALAQRSIALADLEAGRLIALSSIALRLGYSYRAIIGTAKADRPDIRAFVELLKQA